jgi:hypothetical protein
VHCAIFEVSKSTSTGFWTMSTINSLSGQAGICLYKRIFMDYTYSIRKIYTAGEIEKAKQSLSFEREYNLKYLGVIGNVFHTKDIEAAIEKGRVLCAQGL